MEPEKETFLLRPGHHRSHHLHFKSSLAELTRKMSVNPQATPTAGIFRDSTRYAVMAVATFCLTAVMSNALAFNFTVICMNDGGENATAAYSEDEKGWLFSAIAVGTLIGTVPITTMTTMFGIRNMFTGFCLVSGIATMLTPLATTWGFGWVFLMRVCNGFALAISFPALGSITAQWSTLKGSGMYIALMSCHLQFGPIFTMPVSGALCVSSLGWPAIYYLQGVLTLFASALFYAFYRDSPRFHKSVSSKELGKIEFGKTASSHRDPVPYGAILSSWPIWGVLVSSVGGAFGFQIFMQYGPTYLNKVLGYEIESTGFATAVPYVASCLVKVVAGPFSDRATCISEKTRLITFTIISQGCMALCFIILAFIPEELSFFGWLAYTAAIAFSGLNCVGVVKCAQLVSRHYIHFVMASTCFIGSIIVLVLPAFVRILAPNNSGSEWAFMFLVIAVLILVTNGFFIFVADAKPAPWTKSVSACESKPEDPPLKPQIQEIEPSALERPTFHTVET